MITQGKCNTCDGVCESADELCLNCWEVERRIDTYAKSDKGFEKLRAIVDHEADELLAKVRHLNRAVKELRDEVNELSEEQVYFRDELLAGTQSQEERIAKLEGRD